MWKISILAWILWKMENPVFKNRLKRYRTKNTINYYTYNVKSFNSKNFRSLLYKYRIKQTNISVTPILHVRSKVLEYPKTPSPLHPTPLHPSAKKGHLFFYELYKFDIKWGTTCVLKIFLDLNGYYLWHWNANIEQNGSEWNETKANVNSLHMEKNVIFKM